MSRKRTALSVYEKIKIIQMAEANPHENQKTLCQRIGIPYSTLNTILSKKGEIKDAFTAARPSFSK